jgi:hypothetical protein
MDTSFVENRSSKANHAYLTPTEKCRRCGVPGHIPKYCPNVHMWKMLFPQPPKFFVSSNPALYDPLYSYPSSLRQYPQPLQHFPSPTPIYLPQLSKIHFPDPFKSPAEKKLHHCTQSVPDNDFPSLAGYSLENSLLNSPLELDDYNPIPNENYEIYDDQEEYVDSLANFSPLIGESGIVEPSPTSQTSHQSYSYARPAEMSGSQTSEEMSNFEEAIWPDELEFQLAGSYARY